MPSGSEVDLPTLWELQIVGSSDCYLVENIEQGPLSEHEGTVPTAVVCVVERVGIEACFRYLTVRRRVCEPSSGEKVRFQNVPARNDCRDLVFTLDRVTC